MSLQTRLSKLPWPLRSVLLLPVRVYLLGLELLVGWRLGQEPNVFEVHVLKVAVSPGPNQELYLDRLRRALALLAERSPQTLRRIVREIRAVVLVPHRIRSGGTYSPRSRVVILDQVVVWRWHLESVATEIAGWAIEARLRRGGFGGERHRVRREHKVLLEKITLAGVLLDMESSAADLLERTKREWAGHAP